MESTNQVKLYFGLITAMLAFIIITGGFIVMVIRYQKRLLLKQQQLLKLDAQYKKELLQISVESAEANSQQIAKDIHDEIGSIFSTLAISVNRFSQGSISESEHTEGSRNLIQFGIDSVRRISHAIVPFELELLGLERTLDEHLEKMQQVSGLKIEFENSAPLDELSNTTCLAIYRVVQELSSNCLKYASANKVLIAITNDDQNILLCYNDDGIGADMTIKGGRKGIGLKNIESRILLLDGTVEFLSQPGQGFSCNITIPLPNSTTT